MPGPTKCNGPRCRYLRSSGGARCQTVKQGALMVSNDSPLVGAGRPPVAFESVES